MGWSGIWESRLRFIVRVGVVGVCVAGTFAACATGVGSDDSDVIDNSNATTTGTGGAGGVGGATSATAGGMGGMGGTLAPCDEDPCKLTVPQCGCFPGDKCSFSAGNRLCRADGTVAPQGACSANNCAAGALCLNLWGLSTCHSFCEGDMDCQGGGGKCLMRLGDGMGGQYDQLFCSDNCDPVSTTGCNEPNSKCEIGMTDMNVGFTVCAGAGSGTQAQACTVPNDCAAGFSCVTINNMDQCARYCTMSQPQCMGVEQCLGFPTPLMIGSVEYGVCF